jgi:hypothetical protein
MTSSLECRRCRAKVSFKTACDLGCHVSVSAELVVYELQDPMYGLGGVKIRRDGVTSSLCTGLASFEHGGGDF